MHNNYEYAQFFNDSSYINYLLCGMFFILSRKRNLIYDFKSNDYFI